MKILTHYSDSKFNYNPYCNVWLDLDIFEGIAPKQEEEFYPLNWSRSVNATNWIWTPELDNKELYILNIYDLINDL